jgi:hypothetical protein
MSWFARSSQARGSSTVLDDTCRQQLSSSCVFRALSSKAIASLNKSRRFRILRPAKSLKTYIAAPPDRITINAKFVRQYQVPNLLAVVMFTNHDDALAPTRDDRRYFIHRSLLTEKPADEVFTRYWDWLNSGGDAKVVGWLKARDIGAFNPYKPAPMTAAKQEMIDLTQPLPLQWCKEQLREDGQFENRGYVSAQDLVQAADRSRSNASRGVNKEWAWAALEAEGFTELKQIHDGKYFWRLWARNPLLAQLSRDEIKRRWARVGKCQWLGPSALAGRSPSRRRGEAPSSP